MRPLNLIIFCPPSLCKGRGKKTDRLPPLPPGTWPGYSPQLWTAPPCLAFRSAGGPFADSCGAPQPGSSPIDPPGLGKRWAASRAGQLSAIGGVSDWRSGHPAESLKGVGINPQTD